MIQNDTKRHPRRVVGRKAPEQDAFEDMHFPAAESNVPERLRRSGRIMLWFGCALPLAVHALARYLSTRVGEVAVRMGALDVPAVTPDKLDLKPFISDRLAHGPVVRSSRHRFAARLDSGVGPSPIFTADHG